MKKTKQYKRVRAIDKQFGIDKIILKQIRENKSILYGARSIQRQSDVARDTQDYDVLSKNPKKSAKQLQKRLDKMMGFNYFYDKPAMHKGTFKVKTIGVDMIKDTKDDQDVADFTKMPIPKPAFYQDKNLKIRALKEEMKAKQNSLSDPLMEFRHKKDQDDLNRIKWAIKVRKMLK